MIPDMSLVAPMIQSLVLVGNMVAEVSQWEEEKGQVFVFSLVDHNY